MAWRTPHFWYQPRGLCAAALMPFAALYSLGRALHVCGATAEKPAIPVICIGNIVAGGGGKTPAARAVMALLQARHIARNPHFLTRGYGADESRLLAADAPTITAPDRIAGIAAAQKSGADMIVMDDGFQNPHLRATVNMIVIDGTAGLGNGCLLPAGPLREKPNKAWERADGFIFAGDDHHNLRAALPPEKPVFFARIAAQDSGIDRTKNYVAFAGLARPEKFHDTLRAIGLNVVAFVPLPDHHKYSKTDIARLVALGRQLGADLITTEKDATKLPPDFTPAVLPITMYFDDPDSLADFLKNAQGTI